MAKKKFSVYLSHSRADREVATKIAEVLRKKGIEVLPDWSDRPDDPLPGEEVEERILRAVGHSSVIVLLVSPDYLASRWSNLEAGIALGEELKSPGKRVVRVLLRGVERSDVPALLRPSRALDATRVAEDVLADRLGEIVLDGEMVLDLQASQRIYDRTADEDRVVGSGLPATPQERAAREVVSPQPGAQAIQVPAPQPAPARPEASLPPPSTPSPLATVHGGDEELVLLDVLRLMNRVIRSGTLAPVERAFVAGAKIMFEHLACECQAMLERRESNVARVGRETARAQKATEATPHADAPAPEGATRLEPTTA
jgi:hypothetical protein